jgi:predicted unusual protein kinase regulating ubiquinone biosynthesis (AarF/ABC1/UbiB family)
LNYILNNINNNPLWKDKVRVPEPYLQYCTKYCLIMEQLKGEKLIGALQVELKTFYFSDLQITNKD